MERSREYPFFPLFGLGPSLTLFRTTPLHRQHLSFLLAMDTLTPNTRFPLTRSP